MSIKKNKQEQNYQKTMEKILFGKEMEGKTVGERMNSVKGDSKELNSFIERSADEWNKFLENVQETFAEQNREELKKRMKQSSFWINGGKEFFFLLLGNFFTPFLFLTVIVGMAILGVKLNHWVYIAVSVMTIITCVRAFPCSMIRMFCLVGSMCVLITSTTLVTNPKTVSDSDLKALIEKSEVWNLPGLHGKQGGEMGGNDNAWYVSKKTTCVSCHGTGRCKYCYGTGKVKCGGSYGCTICHGTNLKDCTACVGGVCNICDGERCY